MSLEPKDDLLRATCTCPYFGDRLEICTHIWATVLAAEAKGLPLIRPGPAPASIERKPKVADAILTASTAPLADLRREDLELLLS